PCACQSRKDHPRDYCSSHAPTPYFLLPTSAFQKPGRTAQQTPIDHLIAHHRLHIKARFAKRNGLHKLSRIAERGVAQPVPHAEVACVVGSERLLDVSVEGVEHLPEVATSQADVIRGVVKPLGHAAAAATAEPGGSRLRPH